MKADKREVPSLYWKVYKLLETHGLDDGTISTKLASSENAKVVSSKFRLNKREARKVEKELEYWFGKKPNGDIKDSRG